MWKPFLAGTLLFLLFCFLFAQSPSLQGLLVYMHFLNFPFWLSDPSYHGLPDARNFQVHHADGTVVRGWHILPAGPIATRSATIADPIEREQYFDSALRQASSIVLSFHGNSGNRGTRDRVAEIRLLASHTESHVLIIDYRGFGDSSEWPTFWPSEESTAEDALGIWNWLEKLLSRDHTESCLEEDHLNCSTNRVEQKKTNIFLYGHSLGCAVATQLASHVSRSAVERMRLSGLILVAPFTSAPEVARDYPYAAFFRVVPYMMDALIQNLHYNYSNVKAITHVKCPILILHGADDFIIPVDHSRRLMKAYVDSIEIPCESSEASTDSSLLFDCRQKDVDSPYNTRKHYVHFVELPNAGHNWACITREWLSTVPNFIEKFNQFDS